MRRAFTLIELLVVVSIIALLIAILLPALSKARESAGAVQCMSNTRQMALANEMYADEHKGHYPYNYWLGDGSEWVEKYEVGSTTKVVYWVVNENFLSYLGFTEEQIRNTTRGTTDDEKWGAQWPDEYLCPEWDIQETPNYVTYNHRNSYGYSRGMNSQRVNVAQRTKIPQPDKAYAHMDAHQWHMLDRFADYKNLTTAVEYRHSGGANVSFFDGHVATIKQEDFFHYVNDGTVPDAARNAEHWDLIR